MHRNPYWLGFLGIVLIATLWVGGKTTYQLMRTLGMSEITAPDTMTLTIKEVSSNAFIPVADYTYSVDGNLYRGKQELTHLDYMRETALKDDLPSLLNDKKWVVHYNPASPGTSSLTHVIPYKNIAYTAILMGLFGYFLWLGTIAGSGRYSSM